MSSLEINTYPNRGKQRQGILAIKPSAKQSLAATYNSALWHAREKLRNDVHEIVTKKGFISPLRYVLEQMENPANQPELRLECARIALPYLHSKAPVEVEVNQPDDGPTRLELNAELLKELSSDELRVLFSITSKLAKSRGAQGGNRAPETVEASYVLPGDGAPSEGAVRQAHGVLQSGDGAP